MFAIFVRSHNEEHWKLHRQHSDAIYTRRQSQQTSNNVPCKWSNGQQMVAMLPVVTPSGSAQAQQHQIALLAFYTQQWPGRGGEGFINHDPGLHTYWTSHGLLLEGSVILYER